MCGIAGFLVGADFDRGRTEHTLRSMTRALNHRGPDASGIWADGAAGIGFAHTRLSIVDVSDAGSQPMHSASGRFVVTYNGEIYNAAELRAALEARRSRAWRGHSDTEVLLAAIDEFGVEATLQRIDGMFAFALWDRRDRQLTLARDAFGEKPLYYGLIGRSLVFASDLTALKTFPGFTAEIDRAALTDYLRYGFVAAPRSIFSSIAKLPPGSSVVLETPDDFHLRDVRAYWNPIDAALAARTSSYPCDDEGTLEELDRCLRGAVSRRMISDVPIGCMLSGGIDSSLTASLMAAQSAMPIKAFHLSSGPRGFDESEHARSVAQAIGADFNELRISGNDCLEAARHMSATYSEPFADSSQIPTYLISQFAAGSVKVALSGDGGDELFGGYNRYTWNVWSALSKAPHGLRRIGGAGAHAISRLDIERIVEYLGPAAPSELRSGRAGAKLAKLASVIDAADQDDYHLRLLSLNQRPAFYAAHPVASARRTLPGATLHLAERMMLHDTLQYLPDDILVKVDRASMAHGLEVRTPFLCRAVFELAWRMPVTSKIERTAGKLPLRALLGRYVPRDTFERPKQGFAIPVGEWLRSELKDWAEDLLDEQRLADEGMLAPAPVRALWRQHQRGRLDLSAQLWPLLVFQSWWREQSPVAATLAAAE